MSGGVSDIRSLAPHDSRMDGYASAASATERFTVICAWCGRELSHGTPMVSHGICPGCAEQLVAQAKRLRRQAVVAGG